MKTIITIFLVFSLNVASQTFAAEDDYIQCTRAINFYEEKYGLPRNLLHSIAIVESGKWVAKHNKMLPWPWALNVAGQAYYFANKGEAVSFLKTVLERGIEQVDIGCTQINWYYHGKKYFKKPEDAFNPVFNTAYAAHFLSNNYLKTKDWTKAVAIYHSYTEDKGRNYVDKVHKIWKSNNMHNKHHKYAINQKDVRAKKSTRKPKTFHKLFIKRDDHAAPMIQISKQLKQNAIVLP